MEFNLKVGNIVKVVSEDYSHWNQYGQVVRFNLSNKKKPIRVWFGKEVDYLFSYDISFKDELSIEHRIDPPSESEQMLDMRTWNHSEDELEKVDSWKMKTLADRYFPRFYHSFFEPKELFVAGSGDCNVRNCLKLTTKRIICNVCGTVFSVDVCNGCAEEYNLKCMDDFPWKEREKDFK